MGNKFLAVSSGATETGFVSCFEQGYESLGHTWTGTAHELINQTPAQLITNALPYALANGYNYISTNFGISQYYTQSYVDALASYDAQGVHVIAPAGSNIYHDLINETHIETPVLIGSGITSNGSGYYAEFFDEDPLALTSHISAVQQVTSRIKITTNTNPNLFYDNYAVWLSGITGFANNPSGLYEIDEFVTDGFFNKFYIADFSLGSGSYGGNGSAEIHFQSYSAPFVCGKIAMMMNEYGLTLQECRDLLRGNADYKNVDIYSGFGKVNVSAALGDANSSASIDLTPGTLTAELESSTNIHITYEVINDADSIEIYRNNTLIATIDGGDPGAFYDYTISGRSTPANRYRFRYRGLNGDSEGDWSNTAIIPYMKSRFIQTRS